MLEAFSAARTGEAVSETLPEHLRSMLVAMASSGLLRAPAGAAVSARGGKARSSSTLSSALASKGLWDATMSALAAFCPQLQEVLLAEAQASGHADAGAAGSAQPARPQQQAAPTATSTVGAVAGRLYSFIS